MKLFYTLTAAILLTQGSSFAQDLAVNEPAKTSKATLKTADKMDAPVWNKDKDQVTGRIDRSKLTGMKTAITNIVTLLRTSCFSEGSYIPVWHVEYISDKLTENKKVKFTIDCNFADQKAHLTVVANDMNALLQPFALNNQPIYTMKPSKVVKNGASYFDSVSEETHTRTWLVTTGDQQPYLVVSRKEYLENAQAELHTVKEGILAQLRLKMPVRSAEAQAAEKKALINQLSAQYSGAELEFRMRQFNSQYKSDEDYFKEAADHETASVDTTAHMIDRMLHNLTKEDGDKPAVVSVAATDFLNFEDGKNENVLVKMNPAYFNLTVSEEKAQFFVVSLAYNPNAPQAADLDKQLQDKLDCAQLKTLLGK